MKKINKFSILKVLSICLVFVIFFQFISCNRSSTEKKYSNKYFSFMYPIEWKATNEDGLVTITGPIEDAYFVNIKFSYNSEINLPLDEFKRTVENQNNLDQQPGFVDGGDKEIKIGEVSAINHSIKTKVLVSKDTPYIDLCVNLIYLVKDDKLGVVVTTEVPGRYFFKYEQIFNKIINSFKFK